jgi:hypothetical protein
MTWLRVLLVLTSLSLPAWATGEPITFTVTGHGGLSDPVENLHDGVFWWADTTGTVSSLAYETTGFSIAPDAVAAGYTPNEGIGSLLLSSAFTLQEDEELSFAMDVFAGRPMEFAVDTVGFALLLEDSRVHSVLAVVQPSGRTFGSADGLGVPHRDFAAPSPGVDTSMTTIPYPPPSFTFNGDAYNTILEGSQSNTCCLTEVSSRVTPGTGTYQLLVGAFVYNNLQGQMGVAVTEFEVPEVKPFALVGLGLGICLFIRRRVLPRGV